MSRIFFSTVYSSNLGKYICFPAWEHWDVCVWSPKQSMVNKSLEVGGGGPQTYPLDVFATEGRMVRPNISAEPLSQTLQEQKAI